MKFFFEPETVALIGATDKHGKPGRSLHRNLVLSFGDRYYPVNPKGGDFEGKKVYASLGEIPVDIDLAIIFIPPAKVPAAVEDCAKKGVKGVVIESAGFSETGEEGRRLQEQIVETARAAGMRVWGPNCMGVINANRGYVMSFMATGMWKERLVPGGLSLIVQSGMLSAGFLMAALGRARFGLGKVCSIGNKADVNELDVLEYLVEDPETEVITMYVESINDGARFLKAAKSADKPIVVLKGGTTESGAKAAVSHTASMAGNARVVEGALRQANVVRVRGFHEMLDAGRLLSRFGRQPKRNPGIAILTFSGAAGIITSDTLEQMGMRLAEFSSRTLERLKGVYPSWMPPENPADLYPAMEIHGPEKTYMESFRAVLPDTGVDAVILHVFAPPVNVEWIPVDLDELQGLMDENKKPVITWIMGDPDAALNMSRKFEEKNILVAPDIHRAVSILAAVFSGREKSPQS